VTGWQHLPYSSLRSWARAARSLRAPRERLHRPSALVAQHFDTINGVIVSTGGFRVNVPEVNFFSLDPHKLTFWFESTQVNFLVWIHTSVF